VTENTSPVAAEATSSTSPIVRLDWVGGHLLAAPPSHAKAGLTVRLKARSITLYRANGEVVHRNPIPGRAEVEQLLRASAREAWSALIGRTAAEAYADWVKANPKADDAAKATAKAEALAKATATVKASGSIILPVAPRAARTSDLDVSPEAEAAMLAAMAEAEAAEAEAEAKAKAEAKAEAK
jgi:colicin import membrane protein